MRAIASRALIATTIQATVFLALTTQIVNAEVGSISALKESSAFSKVLKHKAPAAMVADDGAVGVNRRGYVHAAAQRDVLWLVLRALIENDVSALDRSVKALEYAFAKQTDAGNFANGRGVSARKAVGADAFFLQAYCRVRLLISASDYRNRFDARFRAMDQKITSALNWLVSNQRELYRQDKNATNRLFFDALAFSLCGKISRDDKAMAVGKRFAAAAFQNQAKDGSFLEHGGSDSSYQAVSLLNAAILIHHFPNTRSVAIKRLLKGAEWQLNRIGSNGRVSAEGNTRTGVGREGGKEINYYEVAQALFYIGQLTGEDRYISAGQLVSEYINAALR